MDRRTANAIRLMKDISKYGFDYLENSNFAPDKMTDKQVLLMAYFTHAQANFDGVIALVCKSKSQPATARLQLRALQETWINMFLMVCMEDDLWSSYLYAASEYDRVKVANWLLEDGQIDNANFERVKDEATQITDRLRQEHPLPDIDGVMHPSRSTRNYYKKPLSLREKCQIIDHYKPPSEPDSTVTKNYDLIYRHLSSYVHQDARTVLSAVQEEEGRYRWDISGTTLEIVKTMSTSYAYYTGCLQQLTDLIGNTNNRRMKLFEGRFEKYLR